MDFGHSEFDFENTPEAIAIVEVGVNHNGDMDLARRLIDEVKKNKGHIVKFQAFIAADEISIHAEKAEYQKLTTGQGQGQLEMAQALELSHAQLREIHDYCATIELPFLCTAFESKSLQFLVKDLGVKAIKVASSEVTNHPFLAEIAKSKVGIIMSTGASNLEEVAAAMRVLEQSGAKEVALLHCVSEYPAPLGELNLRAMDTMRRAFGVPVGYSDHTVGIEAPIIASALGACIVEKHFTLDRSLKGPDHLASIEPNELGAMMRGMKAASVSLGNGIKRPVSCEIPQIPLIRKSIVAVTDLVRGTRLTEKNITFKRPLNGIEPFDLDKVLDKELKVSVKQDQPITWDII